MRTNLTLDMRRMYPDPAPGIIYGGVHGMGGTGPVAISITHVIPEGP